MIGIDTHLLLRLRRNDDPAQNKRTDALLAAQGHAPGALLVTDAVLAEAAFAFEDHQAVAAAVTWFEAGSCGFADGLVVAKHAANRCDFSATFGRGKRKLPGVKVLCHS